MQWIDARTMTAAPDVPNSQPQPGKPQRGDRGRGGALPAASPSRRFRAPARRRRPLGPWLLVAWACLPATVVSSLAAQPPSQTDADAAASPAVTEGEAEASAEALVDTESAVDGKPRQISDWALAGISWSDAHLVRRLAKHAAQQATAGGDTDRVRGLRSLQEDCSEMIELLGRFGWRQLERRAPPATDGTGTDTDQRTPAETAREGEPLDLAARVETETPAGANDPGVDDEAIPGPLDFDLTRYRVDDYIDEREAEARNRADAIEDGAEAALAAGVDNVSGNYGVGAAAGRLSQRELSTRSDTLPYSKDSIYDSDDFDPNVDYDVDNPLTRPVPSDSNPLIDQDPATDVEETRSAANRGEIDRIDEPSVEVAETAKSDGKEVKNEDDLVAALTESDSEAGKKTSPSGERTATGSPADLRRFTTQRPRFRQDAAWVQFHFDVNDQIWQTLPDDASPARVRRMLDAAIIRLQSHARVAQRLVEADDLERAFDIIGKP